MAQQQHAFINLVEMMGGDLAVVNSARVSYGKSVSELNEKDIRLIARLLREHHGTPFEQAVFTFYVRCPIFVAREWFRHRIGSFNEISGRYKELDTDFYVPKNFRVPAPNAKQMDYQYEDADPDLHAAAVSVSKALFKHAEAAYKELLEMGIAKEHARIVLPVSLFTEFRWTVNARALMNFLTLRNHPTAMREIMLYASSIENIFKNQMPATYDAYIAAKRVAP